MGWGWGGGRLGETKSARFFVKNAGQANKCRIFRQIWLSSKKMQDFSLNMDVKRKNARFFVESEYGCQAKK